MRRAEIVRALKAMPLDQRRRALDDIMQTFCICNLANDRPCAWLIDDCERHLSPLKKVSP
jgi:hypothetical protein